MNALLESGRMIAFLMLIVQFVLFYFLARRARTGKLPYIRHIRALDAIPEGVGRATELGRPIYMAPGRAPLNSDTSSYTLAANSILAYTAGLAAEVNTKVLVTAAYPELIPLFEDSIRNAYVIAGNPELYSPTDIQFAPSAFPWVQAVLGTIGRERPGLNLIMGSFGHEIVNIAEAGHIYGGMNIGGTASMSNLAFIVACCDYSFISEELFVAGAYISKDPDALGSIEAEDYLKAILLALFFVGIIMITFGSTAIYDFLKM